MSSDPIASKSAWICSYMGAHQDTLVAYAQYYAGARKPHDVQLTRVDAQGMTLRWSEGGRGENTEARVAFEPPLKEFGEVKGRMLEMREEAMKGVGMTAQPQITTFILPSLHIVPLILLLFYVTLQPSPTSIAERIRSLTGSWRTVRAAWVFMILAHALETAYMAVLARRHRVPWGARWKWLAATAAVGYAALGGFRSLVKQKRIESIGKAA